MAPRGRHGKGLSRMERAVHEMVAREFDEELVRSKLKNLLKEYGGKVGLPFIEEDDYRVLMEALLTPDEEVKQGEIRCSDGESAVKHDSSAEHEVHDVSLSISAGASEGGDTETGYKMPNSAFYSEKDGESGNISVGSAQEGHGRSNKRQKTCCWTKDGEEYRNHDKEDASK